MPHRVASRKASGSNHIVPKDQQGEDEAGSKPKAVSGCFLLYGGGALLFLLLNIALLSTSPFRSAGLAYAPSFNLIALWPFFQPLSPAASLRLSNLTTAGHQPLLLCASSSCLEEAQKFSFPAEQLVLPPLCEDTPLQPFILHHAFYKAVLEKEFPSVLQLVTSLCILYKSPGVLLNPNMQADSLP